MPSYPGITSKGNLWVGLAASTVRDTLELGSSDDVTFGTVTATSFFGDGSGLTGVVSFDQDLNTTDDVTFNSVFAPQYRNDGVDPPKFPEGAQMLANPVLFTHSLSSTYDLFDAARTLGSGSKISSVGSYGQGLIIDLDYNGLSNYETFKVRFNSNDADMPLSINRYQQTTLGRLNGDNTGRLNISDGTIRVENTYTDVSNNEYLEAGFDTNVAWLRTVANGTGTQRNLNLEANGFTIYRQGFERVAIGSVVTFSSTTGSDRLTVEDNYVKFWRTLYPGGDAVYDVGRTTFRFRDVYATQYRNDGTDPPLFPEGLNLTGPLETTDFIRISDNLGENDWVINSSAGNLYFTYNNNNKLRFKQGEFFSLEDNDCFAIGNSTNTPDVRWYRDAPGIWAMRHNTEQRVRIYNKYTDAANNEHLEVGFDANIAYLRTVANGTGTQRDLYLDGNSVRLTAGTGLRFAVLNTATISYVPLRPSTDGDKSSGDSSYRWSDVYATQYRNDGTLPPLFPEGLKVTEAVTYDETVSTPTGTTQTIELTDGNHQVLSLASTTGDLTLTINKTATAGVGTIQVIQHATTARDITFATDAVGGIVWLGTEPIWNGDATSSVRFINYRYVDNDDTLYLTASDVGA